LLKKHDLGQNSLPVCNSFSTVKKPTKVGFVCSKLLLLPI